MSPPKAGIVFIARKLCDPCLSALKSCYTSARLYLDQPVEGCGGQPVQRTLMILLLNPKQLNLLSRHMLLNCVVCWSSLFLFINT